MASLEVVDDGVERSGARPCDPARLTQEQERRNLLAVLYGGLHTLGRPAGELDERSRRQVTAVTLEAAECVERILVACGDAAPTAARRS